MSYPDALLRSRRHAAYAEILRHPLIDGDASRIENFGTVAELSKRPNSLTPEEIDEQIRQFFASDRL
jgi:hypothetical protein